jgi:nucleoside-diphosphate-sugar epimerase
MKVLFIGGTGIISSACSALASEKGMHLTVFNRGKAPRHVPQNARIIYGDIRKPETLQKIAQEHFDVVVDWVAYTPEQVQIDLDFFRGRTGQYIFISSASAYATPPPALPVTESTPLYNPFWAYSRDKIACEELLLQAVRDERYPVTIVRPSHTYDRTSLPMEGGWTVIDRMRRGQPVVVHGDGTSIWVLTHHADFAKGFVGLLGNPHAVGEVFHITSDELLNWNQIFQILGRAAGAEPKIVHVPSERIAAFDPAWGDGLLGDKTHSMIFDNAKIKRTVPEFQAAIPFHRGADEIIAWFEADGDRRVVDPQFNRTLDRIIAAQETVRPEGNP